MSLCFWGTSWATFQFSLADYPPKKCHCGFERSSFKRPVVMETSEFSITHPASTASSLAALVLHPIEILFKHLISETAHGICYNTIWPYRLWVLFGDKKNEIERKWEDPLQSGVYQQHWCLKTQFLCWFISWQMHFPPCKKKTKHR